MADYYHDDDGYSHEEYLYSEHGPNYREPKPFQSVGDQIARLNLKGGEESSHDDEDDGEDELKLVEEIESLCMKCGENVRFLPWPSFIYEHY